MQPFHRPSTTRFTFTLERDRSNAHALILTVVILTRFHVEGFIILGELTTFWHPSAQYLQASTFRNQPIPSEHALASVTLQRIFINKFHLHLHFPRPSTYLPTCCIDHSNLKGTTCNDQQLVEFPEGYEVLSLFALMLN
jgi:hypothetical protein